MIGIIGAIPEEINAIINEMQITSTRIIGKRKYYVGTLENIDCVVVYSRIGKVAATITTTTLIQEFKITQLIFTGVAGGLTKNVKVGDIVLASHLAQHDFNAFPLFPKNEIPLTHRRLFKTNVELTEITETEISNFLKNKNIHQYITADTLADFNITEPELYKGLIVSGDQFVHKNEQVDKILIDFPEALCVEMEGAAVAQVCFEYEIPFTIIRTISDKADETASTDFNKFIDLISNKYGLWIIKNILKNIQTKF